MLLRPRGELASLRSERTPFSAPRSARESRRGSHVPRTPSGLRAENLPRGQDSGGKAKPGVCVCVSIFGGGKRPQGGRASEARPEGAETSAQPTAKHPVQIRSLFQIHELPG